MHAVWAAAMLLRRLRSELGVLAILLTLIAATAFLFAAAPRLLNLVSDRGIRHELGTAPVIQRHLQMTLLERFNPRTPLDHVTAQGAAYEGEFPASLRGLIGDRSLVVTTGRFFIVQPPRYPTFVTLRHQDPLDGAIRMLAGRWPRDTGDSLPDSANDDGEPQVDPPPDGRPRVEISVSEATAAEIGVEIGDRLVGSIDASDPILPRGSLGASLEVELEIVGIFVVTNPDADFWLADGSLYQASVGGSIERPIAYATALVAPDAFPRLLSARLPMRYQWRYFLDPERLDAEQVEPLVADLRQLATTFVTAAGQSNLGTPVLRLGLPRLLAEYLTERSAAVAVLAVAAIGPFALAAGAIGMVAILLVTRRRTSIALARGRGASSMLLLGAQLWEAIMVAGSAAVIGLAVATTVVPGRASSASAELALAIAGSATLALMAATWPSARRSLGSLGRDDPPVLRTSPRRLVLELTAVGMAVAGVFLLRQRGLTIDAGSGQAIVRLDPFLAAVPVLAGLAVGIVAMRLYPLPIRGLGWLAALGRGLVPVLGLRTIGRHPAAANLPLVVLMLAAAFGSFSSVVMATIDRGQVEASWTDVGADYRIQPPSGGAIAPGLDPGSVSGVVAVAEGWFDPLATLTLPPGRAGQVLLQAVEPATYDRVITGAPVSVRWPDAFRTAPAANVGTPASPIPAILSRRLPTAVRQLGVGDRFEIDVRGQVMTFEVVDRRASLPGIDPGASFVVAPFGHLRAAYAATTLPASIYFIRGGPTIGDGLTELLRVRSPSARLISRHYQYAGLRDAPFVAGVADGFRVTMLVAACYTALAVVAALTLTSARRRRDLAFLRTLGLSARQSLMLTAVEHGPPVMLALVPGVGLGIGLALLLGDSLGLAAFIGPEATVRIQVDWAGIAAVSGLLLGVVTLAIATSTWLARRSGVVDALRIGED